MKKFEVEENFHNPTRFRRSFTYKSLFEHNEIVFAFEWDSVGLEDLFEGYHCKGNNEKEAKVGTLKVFACAPED